MLRPRTAVIAALACLLALSLPLAALAGAMPPSDPTGFGIDLAEQAVHGQVPVEPSAPPSVTEQPAAGAPWVDTTDLGVTEEDVDENSRPEWAGKPEWAGRPDLTEQVEGSEETTGIARAHKQIQRNIERAEERVSAGLVKHVPPGLLHVLEKFMSWLGITLVPENGS